MSEDGSQVKKAIISTADLAAKLGLSRWAVSRALNGRGGVSKATTARVRAALREFHFEPDPLARGLRGGPTGMIGVCLPQQLLDGSRLNHDGLHPHVAVSAMQAFYKRLSNRGLTAISMVSSDPAQEVVCIRRLLGLRVEAIVLVAPRFESGSPEDSGLLLGKTICLAIDPAGKLPCTTMQFDRLQAARLTLSHLHQLGHNRLALLGMHPKGRQAQAFEAACRAAGISWRAQVRGLYLDDIQTTPTGSVALGWALAEVILRRKASFTGLIAADDQIAIGALARLQHEGKAVPRDFSLVGHGNFESGGYCNPPLATIEPQAAQMFERAADTLCEQINAAGQIETQEVLINPLLLKRGSTASPPLAVDR